MLTHVEFSPGSHALPDPEDFASHLSEGNLDKWRTIIQSAREQLEQPVDIDSVERIATATTEMYITAIAQDSERALSYLGFDGDEVVDEERMTSSQGYQAVLSKLINPLSYTGIKIDIDSAEVGRVYRKFVLKTAQELHAKNELFQGMCEDFIEPETFLRDIADDTVRNIADLHVKLSEVIDQQPATKGLLGKIFGITRGDFSSDDHQAWIAQTMARRTKQGKIEDKLENHTKSAVMHYLRGLFGSRTIGNGRFPRINNLPLIDPFLAERGSGDVTPLTPSEWVIGELGSFVDYLQNDPESPFASKIAQAREEYDARHKSSWESYGKSSTNDNPSGAGGGSKYRKNSNFTGFTKPSEPETSLKTETLLATTAERIYTTLFNQTNLLNMFRGTEREFREIVMSQLLPACNSLGEVATEALPKVAAAQLRAVLFEITKTYHPDKKNSAENSSDYFVMARQLYEQLDSKNK